MNDPQINWFVLEEGQPTPYEEYYAGSYRPSETLELTLQVWNNRWGQEDAKDISRGTLAFFFETIEDSYLLSLCSVKIGDGSFQPLTIDAGRGRVPLDKVLYGRSNNGSTTSTDNYATITLKFGPIQDGMRNSLKALFADLEFDA